MVQLRTGDTDQRSSVTPEGITETELGQTLLNGANIAMVSWTVLVTMQNASVYFM
jgi:hypothetical protein